MGELTCYLQVIAPLSANASKLNKTIINEDEEDELGEFEVDKIDNTVEESLSDEIEVNLFIYLFFNKKFKLNFYFKVYILLYFNFRFWNLALVC